MDHGISEEVAREERIFPPVHPGRVIELEWLEPLGLSAYELAKAAGVPKQRMYSLVRGERGVSADTALRLSRTLGMPPLSGWVSKPTTTSK